MHDLFTAKSIGHEMRYLKVLIAMNANGLHEIATWIGAGK